jgi:hypothetical protein
LNDREVVGGRLETGFGGGPLKVGIARVSVPKAETSGGLGGRYPVPDRVRISTDVRNVTVFARDDVSFTALLEL